MTKELALSKRAAAFLSAAALVAAAIVPALGTQSAQAAQLTSRSIRITSSVVGATSVTYNVSFQPTQATAIEGIVVDFCQNSPLVGVACTKTNGVTGVPTSGTVTVSQTGATPASVAFNAVTGATAQAGRLVLTHATGITTVSTANPITFSFTATNPTGTASTVSAPGTFYGRFVTYTSDTVADAYDSTGTGANNPGTHLDDGGVALSTARQLTVNARVQEQLEFCVAAVAGTIDTDAEMPANCAAFPSTTAIDIGVVDSAAPSISPVAATSGGNDMNGAVMIRTNAVNGATISYFAEQETSSGKLKVAGQTCTDNVSTVDQCFNSAGATQLDFSTSGEKFGMTASHKLKKASDPTDNLTRDTDYDGDGTAGVGFAWVDTGSNNPAETLASSSTVLDYEMLVLRFAARAAATTPTGSYAVTSTYIATSSF